MQQGIPSDQVLAHGLGSKGCYGAQHRQREKDRQGFAENLSHKRLLRKWKRDGLRTLQYHIPGGK